MSFRLQARRQGPRHPLSIALRVAIGVGVCGVATGATFPQAASQAAASSLRFGADLAHTSTGVGASSAPSAAAATPGSSPISGATGSLTDQHKRRGGGGGAGGGSGSGGSGTLSAIVQANGTQLTLNGSPWQFAGYDDFRLTSTSPGFQCGGSMTDAQVGAALDDIHNNSGATVVRTWFMQSYASGWNQLDRVLTAAAARGMKVIPVLADQWESCEPFQPGVARYRTLAWYQSGYRQVDYGYQLSYRAYAAEVALHYAGNPTIAFWQLVNEAEALDYSNGPCEEALANAAMRGFADDMARVVKANDPSHLVSLGTMGGGQCGASGSADYRNLHAGLIDICEIHDYTGMGALPGDQWNGVATRIKDCHALNKPIFAGEVGIDASIQANGSVTGVITPQSLANRAAFFQQKMLAQFPMGLAGFMIWDYYNPSQGSYQVGSGDPVMAVMKAIAAKLP